MVSFSRVKNVRCSGTGRYIVEGYSPRDGKLHGNLDVTVYPCAEHLQDARTKWLGDLAAYVCQGTPKYAHPCGYLVDYRDQEQLDIMAAAAAEEGGSDE